MKFMIVCHEKVVRIPLEGDEILWVHGERTQGVVKTLVNTKLDEPKLSDISVTRVSYDLVIFCEEHQCRLLRREAWIYLKLVLELLRKEKLYAKERVKPRRVRAMAMTIQYGVRGMILAAQSEAFKQENALAGRLHGLDQQMERKEDENIMDRKIRNLKRSKIPLVKVHWNSKRGPEFTWERKDHMKSKYPQLFVDRAVESAS
ncbi:hypothetical protein Tco_0729550 [Tanacetum coccineum]|uniref:Reverse transcriptase domain-containing protein n=1 Tax=Tanacetum coccineum TaxID=301880 RepID=A0ABQ4YP74_9ASTR